MNFFACIELLPINARQNVIKSAIGSLNSSILGNLRAVLRNEKRQTQDRARDIDLMNDQLADKDEAEHTEWAMNYTAVGGRMSSFDVANKLSGIRSYLCHYLVVVGNSKLRLGFPNVAFTRTKPAAADDRNSPLSINDTLNYQLSRSPDVNGAQIRALADAMNLPYEALYAAKVKIVNDERSELLEQRGELLTMASNLHHGVEDDGEAEAIFDSLPAQVRWRLYATLSTAMKRAINKEIEQLLRYNRIEAAGNVTLIKAAHVDVIKCVEYLSHAEAKALGEYVDNGGQLAEVEALA